MEKETVNGEYKNLHQLNGIDLLNDSCTFCLYFRFAAVYLLSLQQIVFTDVNVVLEYQ